VARVEAAAELVRLRPPRTWTPEEDTRLRRLARENGTKQAATLPEEISDTLAELRGAGGLSRWSKRLLAVALELAPTAATASAQRLRRAGVAVLATLGAMVTADIALAAYLYARHANKRYGHALLPSTSS
jgi:hypothetical protein